MKKEEMEMASSRFVKREEEVVTAAVNDGQQQIIWSHTAPNYSPNHLNQSLEAVIPAKKPQHEKEGSNQAGMLQECSFEQMEDIISLDSGFDKFHSSRQLELDLPVDSLNHKAMAGVTTSWGGNTVASINGVHGEISTRGFLGNGPQKTASFNLTEIAQNMCNDGLDEVDSLGTEMLVSVGGYKVKRKYEILLGHILAKYGDIGVNCCRTDKFRSFYMELMCDIVLKLMDTNIITITDEDFLGQMIKDTEDLEKENLNIGWLKERLNSIREGRQAIQVLNSSSYEKKGHAVLQADVKKRGQQLEDYKRELVAKEAEVKKRGQQLEDYKRELAAKQVEVQDLKKVILAAEHDFVKTKNGFA